MIQFINRIILLFFLFFTTIFYCQNMNIDSLKLIVNKKVNDTIKLTAIGNLLINLPSDSKEYNFYNKKFKAIAVNALKNKNLDNSSKEKAIDAIGVYFINKGFQNMQSDYVKSISYLNQSLKYYTTSKTKIQRASILVSIGVMYTKTGNSDIAINNFFDALKIFESEKDASGISYAMQNIASLYNEQKKYDEALKYYLKTYAVYFQTNDLSFQDKIQKVLLFINIGKCYQELNNCKLSQLNINKGLAVALEINDLETLAEVYFEIGRNEEKCNKNFNTALQQFRLSNNTTKQPEPHSKALIATGEMLIKLKNYAEAESNLINGLNIAKKIKNLKFQKEAAGNLLFLYKERKQFDKAFKMSELHSKLKDSIKSEINNNLLLKKQLQYEYENKESINKFKQEVKLNKIKLANAKQESRKNSILIVLSASILLLLFGGYFWNRNNKQKQEIAVFEKNRIKQKLLLTQMNPHFIFNSIDNIQSLIYAKQENEAITYLTKFSKLTRQILENSSENYISFEDEIEMLHNYMTIQLLLHNNSFDYELTIDENIEQEFILLPPMLTQPFIENAIKHGLKNNNIKGLININFSLKNEVLLFQIVDNGQGFVDKKVDIEHKSLSVKITKERLESMSANKTHTIISENIIGQNNAAIGAKVSFEIPYIYEK